MSKNKDAFGPRWWTYNIHQGKERTVKNCKAHVNQPILDFPVSLSQKCILQIMICCMQYSAVNKWDKVSNIKYVHRESNALFSKSCWCYLPGIVVSGCIYTVINTNGAVTLTAKVALESAGYSKHVSEVCLSLIVYLVPDLKLLTESLSGDVCVYSSCGVTVVSVIQTLFLPEVCQLGCSNTMLHLPT